MQLEKKARERAATEAMIAHERELQRLIFRSEKTRHLNGKVE